MIKMVVYMINLKIINNKDVKFIFFKDIEEKNGNFFRKRKNKL